MIIIVMIKKLTKKNLKAFFNSIFQKIFLT